MNGTWPVTLPPWALTTVFAAFSLKDGLNWTIASTVWFGVLDAAVARRDCAFGAAFGHRADDSERHDRGHDGNGQPATAAELRVGEHAGHLLVPLPKVKSWKVGGRAISIRGDL